MNMTNPEGYIVEYSWEQICKRCSVMGLKTVPELHRSMHYKKYKDDRDNTKEIMQKVNAYISMDDQLPAPSTLDDSHIMEVHCLQT